MLNFYIADIPECKTFFLVRWGSKTSLPCHNCLFNKNEFALNKRVIGRFLSDTLTYLTRVEIGFAAPKERIQNKSMYLISPVLPEFPFIGLHIFIDTSKIFRFESLISLFFGISQLLKEYLSCCSSDQLQTSNAMRYQYLQSKLLAKSTLDLMAIYSSFSLTPAIVLLYPQIF